MKIYLINHYGAPEDFYTEKFCLTREIAERELKKFDDPLYQIDEEEVVTE